jgi:hypothetical protein
MIVCINYADAKFQDSRSFNTKTAYEKGKADKVIEYSLKDIDDLFKEKNKSILSYKRIFDNFIRLPLFVSSFCIKRS